MCLNQTRHGSQAAKGIEQYEKVREGTKRKRSPEIQMSNTS